MPELVKSEYILKLNQILEIVCVTSVFFVTVVCSVLKLFPEAPAVHQFDLFKGDRSGFLYLKELIVHINEY